MTSRLRARGGPERGFSPDAELARAFGVGCGVLVVVSLCGWAAIAVFWLR